MSTVQGLLSMMFLPQAMKGQVPPRSWYQCLPDMARRLVYVWSAFKAFKQHPTGVLRRA
jgi:hypothetical protein